MNSSLETEETNLVATEELVIIQASMINLENGKDEENGIKQSISILLDSESQQTYISKDINDKLIVTPVDKNFTHLEQQGRICIKRPVVEVIMVFKSGFTMKIKTNVAPNNAGKTERKPFRSETIKQTLKQYELANMILVNKRSCSTDLLVGNDCYDIISTK